MISAQRQMARAEPIYEGAASLRAALVIANVAAGMSEAAVARWLGISRSRAHAILAERARAQRRADRHPGPRLDELLWRRDATMLVHGGFVEWLQAIA